MIKVLKKESSKQSMNFKFKCAYLNLHPGWYPNSFLCLVSQKNFRILSGYKFSRDWRTSVVTPNGNVCKTSIPVLSRNWVSLSWTSKAGRNGWLWNSEHSQWFKSDTYSSLIKLWSLWENQTCSKHGQAQEFVIRTYRVYHNNHPKVLAYCS